VTTGFHGFHVTFGTLFLCFCLVRDAFYLQVNKPYGIFFAIAYHFHAPFIKKVVAANKKWKGVNFIELIVLHPYYLPFTDFPFLKSRSIYIYRELLHSILFLFNPVKTRKLVYRTRPTTYVPSQLNDMETVLGVIKKV
jgi:hypothetical protein